MKQMRLVKRVSDDREQQRSAQLAASERRLADQERKLAELSSYHADYARSFSQRARSGMGGASLNDYQTFLGRLAEAVQQQTLIVERLRHERDADKTVWQGAAQRARIVGQVVKRREHAERRALDRLEQKESDERALQNQHRSSHARTR